VFGIVGGGGNAEYLTTDAQSVARIPDRLSWTEAAAIPEVFITAHDALFTQAALQRDERVLIHAVGSGVGLAATQLVRAYVRLHDLGYAHSVEAWRDGKLAGGLYGVSLGAAFFGESMFHRQRDASKVALVHLVQRLRERKFELLDTQATTSHLKRFGAIDIPAREYLVKLRQALESEREFA